MEKFCFMRHSPACTLDPESLISASVVYCLDKMSLVMRKTAFCICETKTQISCAVTVQLISTFVFATRIVQSLYYLNPKFQASSHLVWLYSLVCVGPGRKPRRPVFSERGSNNTSIISAGNKLEGDWGEIVALGAEISP